MASSSTVFTERMARTAEKEKREWKEEGRAGGKKLRKEAERAMKEKEKQPEIQVGTETTQGIPIPMLRAPSGKYVQKLFGQKYLSQLCKSVFQISEEVKDALESNKPIVALESTIITHGMPQPQNYRTAVMVEETVRHHGSVPATVAILEGKVHVGLTEVQLEKLANLKTGVVKTSRRDFPYVLSQGLSGGTTVSGTMLVANQVGIPVFVTGGIGGVHRGAETTLDISADLTELGRTPVTVVSSGVKSILDIEKTIEYLETQGVCVATIGESKDFPAFFTAKSGFYAPYNVSTVQDAAKLIGSHSRLKTQSGILIAVPIPPDKSADGEKIELAIQTAVEEIKKMDIKGKDVTPFILNRVNELTGGVSLDSNIALIKNNAKVGSQIAVELNKLRSKFGSSDELDQKLGNSIHIGSKSKGSDRRKCGRPVVVGGSNVDFIARLTSNDVELNGGTYKGSIQQLFGGVGRNVAECLSLLGANPFFISAIGNDQHGKSYQSFCEHMDLSGVICLDDQKTATYTAVLKNTGDLIFGIGDMDIHSAITPNVISSHEEKIKQAPLLFMDGNITIEAIEYLTDICNYYSVPVWFDPADIFKASKPFMSLSPSKLTYASPNFSELQMLFNTLTRSDQTQNDIKQFDNLDDIISYCIKICNELTNHIPIIQVSMGKHGVLLCQKIDPQSKYPCIGDKYKILPNMSVKHYRACSREQNPSTILSVSGAGDCLAAAMICGILEGRDQDACVKMGLLAANHSLQSYYTVPRTLSSQKLTLETVEQWAKWNPTIYQC